MPGTAPQPAAAPPSSAPSRPGHADSWLGAMAAGPQLGGTCSSAATGERQLQKVGPPQALGEPAAASGYWRRLERQLPTGL